MIASLPLCSGGRIYPSLVSVPDDTPRSLPCGRSRVSSSWRRPGSWRMASTTSASPTLPTSRYAMAVNQPNIYIYIYIHVHVFERAADEFGRWMIVCTVFRLALRYWSRGWQPWAMTRRRSKRSRPPTQASVEHSTAKLLSSRSSPKVGRCIHTLQSNSPGEGEREERRARWCKVGDDRAARLTFVFLYALGVGVPLARRCSAAVPASAHAQVAPERRHQRHDRGGH